MSLGTAKFYFKKSMKAVAIHTSTAEEWAFFQYPLLTLTVTILLSVGQYEIKCSFNIIYYLLCSFWLPVYFRWTLPLLSCIPYHFVFRSSPLEILIPVLSLYSAVVDVPQTCFLSQAWLIIQHCFTYFIAQIVPALFFESSFSWLLFPFATSLSFGDFFLARPFFLHPFFLHYKIFYAYLVYFLYQYYNQPFLQGALVTSIENSSRNHDLRMLGLLIATGLSLLLSLLSWQIKETYLISYKQTNKYFYL